MHNVRGPAQPPASGEPRAFRGVITDWGGVMTNPILDTVRAWLDVAGIDHESYAAAMRPWVLGAYDPAGDGNPIHALERGECTTAEFERLLASMLVRRDGGRVAAEGLLTRMFAAPAPWEPMYARLHAPHPRGGAPCRAGRCTGRRHERERIGTCAARLGRMRLARPCLLRRCQGQKPRASSSTAVAARTLTRAQGGNRG